MTEQPATAAERKARRTAIVTNAIAKAAARAADAYHSLKCQLGNHSSNEGGCANDGSTCLCQCHDPADGSQP
jgi:hypothetical protein